MRPEESFTGLERQHQLATIQQAILNEYPFLEGHELSIKKPLQSPGDHAHNTYLVESTKKGFEIFVAKGSKGALKWINQEQQLITEWNALNRLQDRPDIAPVLLLPEHQPQNFLLLEYIDGETVSERLLSEAHQDEILYQAGLTAGKLHTIQVKTFGDLYSPSSIDWKSYLDQRVHERLQSIPDSNLAQATQHLYNDTSLRYALKEECDEIPVILQRNMYFRNFMIRKQKGNTVIIDYAHAMGGRPFFDLAKLYLMEFYNHPEYNIDTFLQGYHEHISRSPDFNEQMKLYIMITAINMMYFSHKYKNEWYPMKVLYELTSQTGRITELLK